VTVSPVATRNVRASFIALVVAIAVWVYLMPPPAAVRAETLHAGALLILVIGLWALGALPEYLTGLIFFLLAMLLAIVPPNVVFSGFASSTLWLVLGGLILAAAVTHTGLGERFARLLLDRFSLSYAGLIAIVVLVSVLLAFVMPATVSRVLLLIPILTAAAARMGFAPGSNGYNGICLAAIMGTYQCGTSVLPANAPNLILAGAAETLYHAHLTYAEYLYLQFPVMGVLKGLAIVLLIRLLFPATLQSSADTRVTRKPMSAAEWRLTAILLAALLLWMTDFIHGIQPGWVALAAAIVCLLPRVGAVPLTVFNERVRFGPFFYIAAVLGVGSMMSASGLGQALGHILQNALELVPHHDARNFASLTLLGTFTGLATINTVQPAVLAPLAGHFATLAHWPVKAALMTMAIGFGTVFLPYQVPPIVVGLQLAGIPLRTALRLTLPLAVLSLVVLFPVDYFWWRTVGYFGH
jgi:anion transporter